MPESLLLPSLGEYALLSKACYLKNLPNCLPTIHVMPPENPLKEGILYLYIESDALRYKGLVSAGNARKLKKEKVVEGVLSDAVIKEKVRHQQPITLEESILIMQEALIEGYAPASAFLLAQKGWICLEAISEPHGYRGSLWVHHDKQQLVIAHRGSKNLDSWVTDAESIAQLKPGHFVEQAIQLLKHDVVQLYKNQGYRLSTTGHSLGGFLAQVSAYWAQRSEFPSTYYPNIRAVVFDSPGAKYFLEILNKSGLANGEDRIILKHLDIQNFCVMPTIFSTYGEHLGSIWHLEADLSHLQVDCVYAHLMENILRGFHLQTGKPRNARLMRDWPKADYSEFESIQKIIKNVTQKAIALPFDCLIQLYKTCPKPDGYWKRNKTWFEQLLSRPEGQLSVYLAETHNGRFPVLNDFNRALTLSIQTRYVTSHENSPMKTINLHHFDKPVQAFLTALWHARKQLWSTDLEVALQAHYGEGFSLLTAFSVVEEGKIAEIQLEHNFAGTIFEFQSELLQMLQEKKIFSFEAFFVKKEETLQQRITRLEAALSDMPVELAQHTENAINKFKEELQAMQNTSKIERSFGGVTMNIRVAKATVPGASVIRVLGEKDYAPERHQEALDYLKQGKSGDVVNVDTVIAEAPNANAFLFSPGEISSSNSELIQKLSGRYYDPSRAGQTDMAVHGKKGDNSDPKQQRKPNY